MSGKIKPVSNAIYRIDALFFRFSELLHDPQEFLKKVPVKEGMQVVDYGCGVGRYALPIAEIVGPKGKVFAVDIQPLAIRKVEKRASKKGLKNVETVLIDSYNTNIQDSSIDIVLVIDTFHRISNTDAMFQEMHRILKPDGRLFLDKGHLNISEVRRIVDGIDSFTVAESGDDNLLLAPK